MLIIEGTDCLGKTTLAKKLAHHPALSDKGYIYKHFSRLPDGFHRYWGYIEHAASKSVQDRYHMSEIAYAYARKDDSLLDPWTYRMVDGYLRQLGAFTVVLTCDDQLLEQKFNEHKHADEMYTFELVQRANDVFREIGEAESWSSYDHIDIDSHIHLTEENPWPSNHDIRNIFNAYQRRQDRWLSTMQLPQRSVVPFNRPFA